MYTRKDPITDSSPSRLELLVNKGLFYGSFLASLGAGMLIGEVADVFIARPILIKHAPETNLYWSFACSAATGMALTVLGWYKLIAPSLYKTMKAGRKE